MKILLDPILTALPSRCSTYVQFWKWVDRHVQAETPDLYFYWMAADWGIEAEPDYFPKSPMVKVLPIPQSKDRTREYMTLNPHVDKVVGFSGPYWDWDVLVTVRSGLAQLYKLLALSPRQSHRPWVKQIWVIEEMPLMGFKASVAKFDVEVQDRFTIAGYQAADRVMIMSYHEGPEIIARARELLPPSQVIKLQQKIKPVVPSQLTQFNLFAPSRMYEGKRPFNLAYVGRLSFRDTTAAFGVMTKQWIMRGKDQVKLLVCTPSSLDSRAAPGDYMDARQAPREEFWRLCREEMDVVISTVDEGGFSLSVAEPLSFGVPIVLLRNPWSVGMVGPDYPYLAKTETEAYAMAKMFYDDYAGAYAQFAKWYQEWFVPTYQRRYKDDLLFDVLDGYLEEVRAFVVPKFKLTAAGMAENDVVKQLAAFGDEIVVFDVIQKLADEGKLRGLERKAKDSARDEWGLVWSTPWQDYRLALKAFHGFRDASVQPGHLTRGS